MQFIDTTYFDGDLVLVGVNKTSTADAIEMALERYEPECLDKILGAAFAEAFSYGLAHPVGGAFGPGFSSAFNIGGIEPRWQWLRDGKVFLLPDGGSVRWQGLRNARKLSPLANYVYYWYRRNNVTQTTRAGGESKSKGENSSPAPVDTKMVRAWNQMVEWNLALYRILKETAVYPEFNPLDVDQDLFNRINVFGI